MSTRDKLLMKINFLSDEQLEGLYSFISGFLPDESFNEETIEAFAEIEEMKKHPEQYKSYDDIDELFEELSK